MNDEEDVIAYFLWVDEVVNSLKVFDTEVKETTMVQNILRSFPLCFDAKVSAIEESRDLENLKMEKFHKSLIAYEMKTRNSSHKEATFKASKKSRKCKFLTILMMDLILKWLS